MTAVGNRFPRKLAILPGLRWSGKLIVESRRADGTYQCAFDARAGRAFIYDRVPLTARQIRDWTGVDVEAQG